MKKALKWFISLLFFLFIASALLYSITEPKKDRNWTIEHALLANIQFSQDNKNPTVNITNIRDFKWANKNKAQYKAMEFQLEDIVGLKVVVSHFSAISEIAHVFLIVVLNDGRELGISIEARREADEAFSIQGGLLAQFELIYVLATPEDLLGIRKINNESTHIYPIKVTKDKAQELFTLITKDANKLIEEPALYHLFFRNCTNQLVKNVSILSDQKYPWYFQTLAPGNTGKMLYDLDLIDMPNMSFKEIQKATLTKP